MTQARATTPSVLHLSIKRGGRKRFAGNDANVEEQQQQQQECRRRWQRGGAHGGKCKFGRPGCIIGAILIAVVAFKALFFLSAFLGVWAFVLLGFFGARYYLRRRGMRRGAPAGGCPFSQRGCGPAFFEHIAAAARAHHGHQEAPAEGVQVSETVSAPFAPVAHPVPEPVPVFPAPSSASVSPAPSAAIPLSQSGVDSIKSKFESLLSNLAEMGFTDRSENIEKLVANRLNLSATIQSLLNQ